MPESGVHTIHTHERRTSWNTTRTAPPNPDAKLNSELLKNIVTCELLWSITLPDHTIPNIAIVGSWFKHASLDDIISAILDVGAQVNRKRKIVSISTVTA